LARIESGQERPAADPLDLVGLLRETVAAQPPRRRACVDLRLPDKAWAVGDAGMLERMLANLLGNALEYAPAHARIACHVLRTPLGWMVEIANPAPDLDEGDVARFGQRFWRKHAEGGTAQHAGLGLALCHALSEAAGIPLQFHLEDGVLHARVGPLPAL
jgi:two-component system sensor histidine kinase QseC